ncbi:MAG: response regulator [Candidatus Liptonbacteria bacterium]|nr:response regulator [Candidatus Liptonbacteria bacterium]
MTQALLLLVVDDEPYFREIFSKKLVSAGFRVETADSGEAGVKKAKELRPNLVLMDVKMLGVDGIHAMMKIKEDPLMKDTKVAFLTNAGERTEESGYEGDRQAAKGIGAAGYIQKTNNLDEIVKQIKSLL